MIFKYREIKEKKNIYQAYNKHIKAGMALLLSDKLDLKKRSVTRDKRHLMMTKSKRYQFIKKLQQSLNMSAEHRAAK